MKKMTRLMALVLSMLVLLQSAALADSAGAISADAVTEELYQGWVETATTYAADKTVAAGGTTTYTLSNAGDYDYRVILNGSTVNSGFSVSGSGNTVTVVVDDSVSAGTYTIQYGTNYRDDYFADVGSFTVQVTDSVTMTADVSSTTSSNKTFYWRFKNGQQTTDELTELSKHVRISYTSANAGHSGTSVPYGSVTNYTNITLPNGGTLVDISKHYERTNNRNYESADDYIYIETDVGYVVTSYMVGCEMDRQWGESCKTSASLSLEVVLNNDGKYQSKFSIKASDYKGESGSDGYFFGHRSEGSSSHHYVLLITVAQVNVNVNVDKTVSQESVLAGNPVDYEVVANTTNDLTNVQFNDNFFKTSSYSISDLNVYYYDKETYTDKNALTKVSSKESFTDTADPAKYYWDTTNGILYLDGKWKSTGTITITYTYTTPDLADGVASQTIENTVVVLGTKTGTTATVQDAGAAKVSIIVNSDDYGSLRVYKTFKGLLTEDVVGTNGVLNKFTITITDSTGATIATYGVDKVNVGVIDTDNAPYSFSYYWDTKDLKPGSYTVTETQYDASGYICSTNTYTVYVDGVTAEADRKAVDGTVAAATVQGGHTTIVRFENTYVNGERKIKFEKVWQDAAGNIVTTTATDLPASVTFNLFADRVKVESFTLTAADGWKSKEYYTLSADYANAVLTVTEDAITDYELVDTIALEKGTLSQDVTVTDTEKDEDGNYVTHTETKTYETLTYKATNKPSVTDVTLKKQVTGNMGDRSKKFTFVVTDANNNTIGTYSIAHDETATIENVTIGSTIKITETTDGYSASYVVTGGTEVDGSDKDGVVQVTVANGTSIVCTNHKNETVDTGILLDSLPYVLILVLVGGGVVLWLANRRRRRED